MNDDDWADVNSGDDVSASFESSPLTRLARRQQEAFDLGVTVSEGERYHRRRRERRERGPKKYGLPHVIVSFRAFNFFSLQGGNGNFVLL